MCNFDQFVNMLRRHVNIEDFKKEKTIRTMFEANQLVLLLLIFWLVGFKYVHSTCTGACTSCSNDTCVTCNNGSYLESGSCHTCPVQCTSCNNSGVCHTCVEGYFGLSCDEKCHELCLNKACHKDGGICTYGCREGYFDSGSVCIKCDVNCKTCTQTSINCIECKNGNYGPTCQNSCSHCTDGICTKDNCTYGCGDGFFIGRETCNNCNILCTSCIDTFDNCLSCVDGYYGPACQWMCNECSPCNKDDGSCLTTEKVYPPTIITQMTSPSKESTTSLLTTKIFATTSNNTSQHSAINTGSKFQEQNQENPSLDDRTIISASVGGGGGLVVIVLAVIVVIVCKRRGKAKQSDTLAENIDMTENENYISADDIDESIRTSTYAHTEENKEEMKNNDDLYSLPNKANRSTVVTMNPRSAERPDNSRTLIPPKLPGKRNLYSEMI